MNKSKRNIEELRIEVHKFITSGLANKIFTQQSLSIDISVNQATISRYNNGQFYKVTCGLERLCKYANIETHEECTPDPEGSEILNQAINEAWDGTAGHARKLARAIKVIGAISH